MASGSESEVEVVSEKASAPATEKEQRQPTLADIIESDISFSESSDSEDELPRRPWPGTGTFNNNEVGGGTGNKWSLQKGAFRMREFCEYTGPMNFLEEGKSELDFFELIFPAYIITHLVIETNKYAELKQTEKPDPRWRDVSYEEMRAYVGFQIVMGVIQAPQVDMYWSTDPMFKCTGISERMTRDRYDKIAQYFHVADVTENPPKGQYGHDKLAHVRPIITTVKQGLMINYMPHREASIGEALIGLARSHGHKQNAPMKPTKKGIKAWVRTDPQNGYINDFVIYCGKSKEEGDGGFDDNIVLNLCQPLLNRGHHVYCDNSLSSVSLFEELLLQDTYACGIVHANKSELPPELKAAQLMERGSSIVCQKGDSNLVATVWRDKRTVYYLSTNFDPSQPSQNYVHRKQKNRTTKQVPVPGVVHMYGQYKSVAERSLSLSIGRNYNKWWKYIFWFLVDISVTSSYILMKESPNHQRITKTGKPKPRTELEFRQQLAKQMIGNYCQKRKRNVLNETVGNGLNCWIVDMGRKRRCRQCLKHGMRAEPRFGCEGCSVNLCVDCFKPYHLIKFPERYLK